jgi:thioredoxin reductase (NADPH)
MDNHFIDVIILGAGPAGFQAAIHAARRKVSVLVLGKVSKSSAFDSHIENFCCIDGTSGTEMLKHAKAQVEKTGATILEEDVIDIRSVEKRYEIVVESGQTYTAKALVLAMGISRNKLGISREREFTGKGVSFCVDCDGPLFKKEPVAITGCESAAGSGALTMMLFSPEVHLICEKLSMDKHLEEKLRQSDIIIHEGRKVVELLGDESLDGVRLDDGRKLDIKGLFVELGAKGALGMAGQLGVMLDAEMKYIDVNRKQETNIPGIFAAGDICGPPWQVAKAVGEGCVAGLEAAAYAKTSGFKEFP